MAEKKGVGSTKNGRDSHSKRLGVKKFGGQVVKAGDIIIRQRGTKYRIDPLDIANIALGSDHTIYAKSAGRVVFYSKRTKRCKMGVKRYRTYVTVEPSVANVTG